MKFLIILLFIVISITLAGGTWVDTTLVPPSLGFETPVRIYLPEGYDPGGTVNYPVIYWLNAWGGNHTQNSSETLTALDSLISSGQIQPVIVVKPNGYCDPYMGCMWVNSVLYGDYEDYVVYDLVNFIDSTFCTVSDPEYRCIAGHSMGALGSMRIALEYTDCYKAVASHAGFLDLHVGLGLFIPEAIKECPESEPPYTYDWGNGPYTDALFLYAGGCSPNLSAPDSVDFLLDENGMIIDSVWTLWELFNPVQIIKETSPPIDLDIFFDCGDNDDWVGCYESNCGFADTLAALGIEYEFQSLAGVDHYMNLSRFIEEFLFLGEAMTGIEEGASAPSSALLESAFPNPFTSATAIQFNLPEATLVSLQVYDVSGRMVESLIDEELGVGMHSTILEGEDLAPGLYIVVLRAGGVIESKSCIFLR
jgi:enterochelin esterase-like enzyme